MSKGKDKTQYMDVDGRTMMAKSAADMPKGIGSMFVLLTQDAATTIQAIHEHTGLSVERCFQVLLAAQGALYAALSEKASRGEMADDLGDWRGDDPEAIEDMARTFRVNARQNIDKPENVQ